MFSDLEFIDYRYSGIRPLGRAGNKSENAAVSAAAGKSGTVVVKEPVKKKRPCPSVSSVGSHSRGVSTSNKRIKLNTGIVHSSIMSGELQIVFIYDTLSVRKEEDDPKDAILYFHPDCIPEERRIAICGQLMGITHFLVDTFSAPKILTLDNGKFAMRKFGRQYVLALGCSSVTPDWLLEKQADILYNLTIFFHRDIKSILRSVNDDRLVLSSRLSLIMDHYIPISQHHGDLFALTFGILPILNLPKSASNISLNAAVVLQSCLMQNGVLGGIVMYQNKVLGVELAQDLAQKLAFIQPYQLPPAEPVRLHFNCPPGVQIFTVYVSEEEMDKLRKHSATFQQPAHFEPKAVIMKENNHKGKFVPIREEEDTSDGSSSTRFTEPLPKQVSESISEPEKNPARPPEMSTSSTEPELISKETKLKFEEFLKSKGNQVSHTTHIPPDKPANTGTKGSAKENLIAVPPPCVHMNGCGPNSIKSSRAFKSLENLSISDDSSAEKSTPPLPLGSCFCASLTDPYFPFIRCDGKSISKALLDVYAGANESNEENEEDKDNETEVQPVPPNETEQKPNQDSILQETTKSAMHIPPNNMSRGSNEISTQEGVNCVEKNKSAAVNNLEPTSVDHGQSANLTLNSTAAPRRPMDLPLNNKKYSRKKSKRRWSTFEDMMSPVVDTPSRVSESFPAVLPNINENWKNSTEALAATNNPSQQELLSSFRKLSSQDELLNNYAHVSATDNKMKVNGSMIMNSQNPSISGKIPTYIGDTRTTRTVDFGSISSNQTVSARGSANAGNNDGNNKCHAQQDNNYFEKYAHSNKWTDCQDISSSCSSGSLDTKNHVKSSLLIYSLGSMRLLLLLENDKCKESELIQTLWEYGSSSLSELETAISNVEEQTMSTTASQHDHYCYLHYESVWRSLAHGGRNHSMDFDVVQQMHQDFNVYPNISELIIRGEDHVVYGYQCVGSEVFYQQSAGLQPGLPMPSDLMGKVPFKARRRLERDHNILLL